MYTEDYIILLITTPYQSLKPALTNCFPNWQKLAQTAIFWSENKGINASPSKLHAILLRGL